MLDHESAAGSCLPASPPPGPAFFPLLAPPFRSAPPLAPLAPAAGFFAGDLGLLPLAPAAPPFFDAAPDAAWARARGARSPRQFALLLPCPRGRLGGGGGQRGGGAWGGDVIELY